MAKLKKKSLSAAARQRTTPVQEWRISGSEYDERVNRVRQELEGRQLDGLVLFQPIRMAYLPASFT